MAWTLFWDMHSGGGLKEPPHHKIYVEAPRAEAEVIFYNRFGHSPNRVTCTCCGEDYSIDESKTLEEASEFHRGPFNGGPMTLKEHIGREDVLVIKANEIGAKERVGEIPEQGYVWRE